MKKTFTLMSFLFVLLLFTSKVKSQDWNLTNAYGAGMTAFEYMPAKFNANGGVDKAYIKFSFPSTNAKNGDIAHDHYYGMLLAESEAGGAIVGERLNPIDSDNLSILYNSSAPFIGGRRILSEKSRHPGMSSRSPVFGGYSVSDYPIVNKNVFYVLNNSRGVALEVTVTFDRNFPLKVKNNDLTFEFFFLNRHIASIGQAQSGYAKTIVTNTTFDGLDTAPEIFIADYKEYVYITDKSFLDFNEESNEIMANVTAFDNQDGILTDLLWVNVYKLVNGEFRGEMLTDAELNDKLLQGEFLLVYNVTDTSGNYTEGEFKIEKKPSLPNPYRALNVSFVPATREGAKAYLEFTTLDELNTVSSDAKLDYMNFGVKIGTADFENFVTYSSSVQNPNFFKVFRRNNNTLNEVQIVDKWILDDNYFMDFLLIKTDEEILFKLFENNDATYVDNTYVIRLEVSPDFDYYNNIIAGNASFNFKFLRDSGVSLTDPTPYAPSQQSSIIISPLQADIPGINTVPVIEVVGEKKSVFEDNEEVAISELLANLVAFDEQDGVIDPNKIVLVSVINNENNNGYYNGGILDPITAGTYVVKYQVLDSTGNLGEFDFTITKKEINIGIEKFELKDSVVIYPNPTFGFVNIELDKPITELLVSDISSRILYTASNINKGSVSLNIANYPTGIYILTIKTKNESATFKIVKK